MTASNSRSQREKRKRMGGVVEERGREKNRNSALVYWLDT